MSSHLTLTKQVLSTAAAAAILGCSTTTPPPSRVPVPMSPGEGSIKTYPPLRPLRLSGEPQSLVPPPAFDDAPLVTQAVPEEPAYVNAYNHVGKPRVAIFVNRTIEGQLIGADGHTTDTSLAAGQYDEAQAKAIDYQAIELALSDTLSAGGKVTLVNPMMARQRLTDDEVKDLQSGRPQMLREIAEKLDADVLIQAQARPTKQTAAGLEVRVLVEAINTHGGESVARAFVDVPPPLEKTTINRYTRFLARKMMAGLANAWTTMASEPPKADATRNDAPRTSPPPVASPRNDPPQAQSLPPGQPSSSPAPLDTWPSTRPS